MSRAVNLTATVQTVSALCDKHAIGISTIEPLPSGGTRVVLLSSDGAADVRKRMKSQLLEGPVARSSLYLSRIPQPFDR